MARKVYGHIALAKLLQIAAYDNSLENAARRVFCLLAGHSDREGTCYPSVNNMAKKLCLSRAAIIKQINILIQHGYLKRYARYSGSHKGRQSNLYVLNFKLAQEYATETDIFCKYNVNSVVTYLVTLLSYREVLPLEVTNDATFTSDIKRTLKKTESKKTNQNDFSFIKAKKLEANRWQQQKDFEERTGITAELNSEYESVYQALKAYKNPLQMTDFDIKLKAQLGGLDARDALEKKIDLMRDELRRCNASD